MITNRIYKESIFSVAVAFSFLVGLRTYQHPCSLALDEMTEAQFVNLTEKCKRSFLLHKTRYEM